MKVWQKSSMDVVHAEMDFSEFRKEYMEYHGKSINIIRVDYPDEKDLWENFETTYVVLYDMTDRKILYLQVRFEMGPEYKYPKDDPGIKRQWKEIVEWWLMRIELNRNELIYSLDLIGNGTEREKIK